MTPFGQLAPIVRGAVLTAALLLCFGALYALIWAAALRLGAKRIGLCAALCAAAYLLEQWMYDITWRAERALPSAQVPAAALVLALAALYLLAALLAARLREWRRTQPSPMSIKEGIEHLHTGLCFCEESGQVLLMNRAMSDLCHAITGEALSDARAFWDALGSAAVLQRAPSPMLMLADGRVMSFARSALALKNRRVLQITAADVTEQYRLSARLEEDNRRLKAMNARLRRYGETVREVTREREVLAAKVRLHDELGRTLLAARRAMRPSAPQEERAVLLEHWRRGIALICRAADEEPRASNFDRLAEAAKAVGVSVHFRGETPPAGTGAALLIESAVHECLTNTVRHAQGSALFVDIRAGAGWTATCSNSGRVPGGPIAEGCGLGALRASVERAGGEMHIEHAPRFALTVSIPRESEDFAQ